MLAVLCPPEGKVIPSRKLVHNQSSQLIRLALRERRPLIGQDNNKQEEAAALVASSIMEGIFVKCEGEPAVRRLI